MSIYYTHSTEAKTEIDDTVNNSAPVQPKILRGRPLCRVRAGL